MNKKNGFTLIELISVVIILALTFMFVAPKMASLIKEGNNNEVRLIEQKALVSAKNYINNYDTNFLNNFIEVGHTKTVYKEDLIDNGLMTLEEVEQLEDFRGVQVKLLENDKLEYTISRLSSTKDYTNEEIIQLINELREQVNSNNSNSNIFLKSYPVGSVYISTSSTNPGSTYGGTWEEYAQGRLLAGVGSTIDADGNSITIFNGETGGSISHAHSTENHTLTISEIPSHSHFAVGRTSDGNINPVVVVDSGGSTRGAKFPTVYGWTSTGSGGHAQVGSTGGSSAHNHGNTGKHEGWLPFIAVYMWKRTA